MSKDERRASGESTIHKGTDGRWHGYVSMGTKTGGKRDRRHVSASTRAAVVAKIRELQERRDAGVTAASGTMTVAAWLDHWLDNIAVNRVRARTLESYRQLVRLHIKPAIGHHRLARLQPEHVEAMHAEMRAKGLASATVLRAHRVLSRALKVAEQRGRVARNVARLVDARVPANQQRAMPSPLRRHAPCSPQQRPCAMPRAGSWHSPSGYANQRYSVCVGRMSTSTPARCASGRHFTGSAEGGWSTRTRSRRGPAGRCSFPVRSSTLSVPAVSHRPPSVSRPARAGRTTGTSSPSQTADRSTRRPTGAPGAHC